MIPEWKDKILRMQSVLNIATPWQTGNRGLIRTWLGCFFVSTNLLAKDRRIARRFGVCARTGDVDMPVFGGQQD
ncbi:MAG: hypothetical protein GZ092_14520 [Polaromonas sp.]|nr:hypothetical protein [Polaromonas sp.]